MCWNCGCMLPDDSMGSKDNITTAMLRKAAKAGGNRNIKDLMEKVVKTYEAKIKGTPADTEPIR